MELILETPDDELLLAIEQPAAPVEIVFEYNLGNAVGTGTGSVTSASYVSTVNRLSGLSTQMTSADNVISAAVNVVSNALSAEIASRVSADNALSNALSGKKLISLADVSAVPSDGQVVMWNSAANKWQASTVAVGTGSVTSQKMSVAIAVETSNRVSADNALSNALSAKKLISLADVSGTPSDGQIPMWNSVASKFQFSTVTGGSGSVTSTELSAAVAVETSNRVSADNAISNAVSIVSQALSAEIVNRTSADNALSTRIDTQSNKISVLSQQVSVTSAYVNKAIGAEFDAGIASTTSVTIDWSQGRNQKFSIVANTPFTSVTNMSAGAHYLLRIVQDGTGNRQPTWGATFQFPGSVAPVLGTTAGAVDLIEFYCDGTTLYGGYSFDQLSAMSTRISNLQSAIQANSAQMTSAGNALSNAISAKTISSLIGVSLAPSDGQVIMWNSVASKWQASTVAVGTGSVTSNELSAAVAVETSNRVSADNALSVIIASNSAQMTSADNAISNAVSIVSQALSVETVNRISADNALSVRIDTQSQAISVLSQQISALSQNLSANSVVLSNTRSAVQANSAQMTSADNAISNAVSIVSQALSVETVNRISADNALSVRVDTQSQAISVLSQQVSALSQNLSANSVVLSNTRSAVIANSAQMTSADNAISAAVVVVSALVSTVASALSARIDTVSNAISAKTISSLIGVSLVPSDGQVIMWNSVAAKWQASTVAAGTGSVTSTELSAAVAVETSNRVSADNALSVIIASNSAQMTSADNAISQALSVEIAQRLSKEAELDGIDIALIEAISVLSQQISVLSQNLSANSVVLSNTRSAVQANSAQMTSADNAISNAVSVVSAAVAVVSALVSTVASALSARIDTVSNALSAKKLISLADVSGTPSDGQIPQWNSVAGKFQFSTVTGGSGSVTSTELSAAVAVETSNRISADNALSNAISAKTISSLIGVSIPTPADQQVLMWNSVASQWIASTVTGGAGSVTSTELSAVSAAAASADASLSTRIDTASNAASIVSQALSVEIANRISADNALSVRIDTQSQGISVLSQQVSALSQAHSVLSAQHVTLSNKVSNNQSAIQANSAQMTSADNAISNAVSIVSQALSVTNATLSNLASAHSVLSQQVSVLSAYVNKAIGSEFDAGIASTTSLVLNWSNGRAQKLSIVANTPVAAPTNLSAGARYILRVVQDATGNRQPTWDTTYVWANSITPTLGGAGATDILAFYCDGTKLYGSYNDQLSAFQQTASVISAAINVISNNLSIVSVAANVLSNQLSNLQSAANALSNQISASGAFFQAVLSGGVFTVSATALTNISGLSLSVSANSLYRITGELMYTFSGASSQNAGFGLTFPGMKQAAGRITMFNLGQQATASSMRQGTWTGAGSGSNIVSGFTANTSGVQYYGEICGLFNVSTTGVIQVQAKATSAGAGAIHILQGSNIKLFKIGG